MAKKIKYSDIAEEKLFQPAIDSAERLLMSLDALEKQFKDILTVSKEASSSNPFKSYDAIKDAEKNINAAKNAVKALDEIEKSRIQIQQQLIKLETEKAKALNETAKAAQAAAKAETEAAKASQQAAKVEVERLKIQQQEIKNKQEQQKLDAAILKATKAETKATQQLTDAEKQEAKLREKLLFLDSEQAKTNADLNIQIQAKVKALKQAAAESSEASTAYQKESARLNRLRNEYKDLASQNKENTAESKALLAEITKLDRRLKDIDESVGQNQRSVGNYRIAVDKLSGSFKLLAGSAVVATLAKIVELFNQNSEGSSTLQKAIGRVTVTLSVLVGRFVQALPILQSVFVGLSASVEKFFLNIKLSFAELPKLLGGSEEKAKELRTQIAAIEAQSASTVNPVEALTAAFSGVGEEIESLIKTNDKLIDRTLSYQKQINALNKGIATQRKEQQLLQIASDDNTTSLEAQTTATIALIAKNNEINASEVAVLEKRLELAQLNAKVNKNSIEAQTELADAFVALEEAKGTAAAEQAEGLRRLREIERDNIELDLDQLIDIADRRKTINEQIAADERNSLEARRAALNEIGTDIEASFRKQSEKIQEGLAVPFNIDDLINETDTVKLNERIKSLGLDEIRQNRLREIIQERLQATQDLAVANQDLTDSEKDSKEVQSDIILQEEALVKLLGENAKATEILTQLDEKRLQNEIDNLRIRIGLATEGSTEIIELNQQLNDKLLEQNQARIEKEKEQAEKQKEIAKLTLEFINNFAEKQLQARIDAIDKEIAAVESRQERLRELAAQGVEDANKNLATEQKKQAELEASREKAIRRQKQIELGLTAIETYNTKVQAGDSNPLGSTIAEIAALQLFVNSLPAFYEGAEKIEDSLTETMSGRDGYVVRVDGSERVLTGKQNAMIGEMSNMELATLAQSHRLGGNNISIDSEAITGKINQLIAVIDSKPVYMGRDYDATRKAIVEVVARKGRIERNRKRIF